MIFTKKRAVGRLRRKSSWFECLTWIDFCVVLISLTWGSEFFEWIDFHARLVLIFLTWATKFFELVDFHGRPVLKFSTWIYFFEQRISCVSSSVHNYKKTRLSKTPRTLYFLSPTFIVVIQTTKQLEVSDGLHTESICTCSVHLSHWKYFDQLRETKWCFWTKFIYNARDSGSPPCAYDDVFAFSKCHFLM